MTITQLQYFIAAAKYLNFTKAAEECYVVQTTITHHISMLEKELGIPLFERETRPLSLTRAGASFLDAAKDIVDKAQESIDTAQNLYYDFTNLLNLGYWGRICAPFLPDIIRITLQENPETRITLHQAPQSELLTMLEKDKLDCFFSTDNSYLAHINWIEKRELFKDTIMVTVPIDHWAASLPQVSPFQLRNERMVMYLEKNSWKRENEYRDSGLENRQVIEVSNPDSAMILTEAGCGIHLSAKHVCPIGNPRLISIPLSDSKPEGIILCCKKDPAKPVLRLFLKMMKEFDF